MVVLEQQGENSTNYKVIKDERMTTTRYYPNLGVSEGGSHYTFFVEAYNAANQLIGDFINYYKNGFGGTFEFKVVTFKVVT